MCVSTIEKDQHLHAEYVQTTPPAADRAACSCAERLRQRRDPAPGDIAARAYRRRRAADRACRYRSAAYACATADRCAGANPRANLTTAAHIHKLWTSCYAAD